MAVDSISIAKHKNSISGKKKKFVIPKKKVETGSQGNVLPSPPGKRSKCTGIRVVHGRIYDSTNGKTCHQCRQKTRDFTAACKNQRNNKPCPIMYCHKCLLNRYGVKAEKANNLGEWACPKCLGICNCSFCMKKRGCPPAGNLINTAKATGYSSVSEMLLKGGEQSNHEKATPETVTLPREENLVSPKKNEKENSVDEKLKKLEKKSGKRKTEWEDSTSAKMSSSSKKLKTSHQEAKLNVGVGSEKKMDCWIDVTEKDSSRTFENDKRKNEDTNTTKDNYVLMQQSEISLPVGRELTSVGGVDVCTEDVGNALQFSEFCSVFGKILDLKKAQAEYVLRDIFHGRTGRLGKFSTTVQFHIHLLSVIKNEREDCTRLTVSGKKSWFNVLKECLSESQAVLKAQGLDFLDNLADYETLNPSQKLKLLNVLCDEIFATERVRNWMDESNTEIAESTKEAKQKLTAAKQEERNLKQKMKDDIAEAIIAKNGAALSVPEHEAIVSRFKSETEKAEAKVYESKGILENSNKQPDALRLEPIFQARDYAYWKLNVSGKANILCQNIGTGDNTLTMDEKWSAINVQEKEVIEKHISSASSSSSRGKRLKAPRV